MRVRGTFRCVSRSNGEAVVEKISRKHGAHLPWTEEARDVPILRSRRKGDRSGRIAYQFAGHRVGRELLRKEPAS